jgi:LemA protein
MTSNRLLIELLKFAGTYIIGVLFFIIVFAIFQTDGGQLSDVKVRLAGTIPFAIAVLFYVFSSYNRIIRAREKVLSGMSDIGISEKRASKLYLQATDAIQKFLSHESDTQKEVSRIRSEKSNTNASNDISIKSSMELKAVIEAYPDLKAHQPVQKLLEEIVKSENFVSETKIKYNECVTNFNLLICSFPTNLGNVFLRLKKTDYYSEKESLD